MAIKARFIGVDKHIDSNIPDLACAGRDARTLYALFRDTFSTIDAQILIDENATTDHIKEALLDTLTNATGDDFVILMFSGHGTQNHRLVGYDSQLSNLSASTVSMSDLADSFKQSRAKSIICILDCCFSGAAPARVLEDTPKERGILADEELIKGTGRVMITASGLKEPAYENSRLQHGLLTHALVEVLTELEEESGLATIMDKVVDRVRITAQGMAIIQTPVALNITEGGFKISPLKKSTFYYQEFPYTRIIRIGSAIMELQSFGLPSNVLQLWSQMFSDGLNQLQIQAINDNRLLDGESLLVIAPTSSGKTFIGEMAAVQAICQGRKAVFLLPYKALVNEKYQDFQTLYGERLGLRVIRCSGDYLDETKAFITAKYDIAVLTYEMFLSLAIRNHALLYRLGLVVLDEAQFITDRGRGIVVELILTQLRLGRERGIEPQLLCLSATIGELNHFDEWLEVQSLVTHTRPVPLEMGVLDRSGVYEYIDNNGEKSLTQLIPAGNIFQRKRKPSSQDIIIPLLKQLTSDDDKRETFLVFRNTRGAAEGCALYLAGELKLPPATDVIDELPAFDLSTTSQKLRDALLGGVAFHNSNLLREERYAIEKAFRLSNSSIRGLTATTTVAAGVNTPASTVIIVEHGFPWEDRNFSVSEMRNMAGRAGRLGYRETGRAIILAGNSYERSQLFEKYVLGKPEPVVSSFTDSQIGTWVLKLLAQVNDVTEDELIALIANTYGGYLRGLSSPNWKIQTSNYLSSLLPRMISAGILITNGNRLQLTLLGRACGESSFAFDSTLQFVELLRHHQHLDISALDLMALVQILPEMDSQYTPLFKRGYREKGWPHQVLTEFGNTIHSALQNNVNNSWVYFARTKRVCILLDWIEGVPIEHIENRYTVNPFNTVGGGDIRGIADTTRFHLSSAFNIASVLLPSVFSDPDEVDHLLTRLEIGIPTIGLELLSMPFQLTRGEYLALLSAGIETPKKLQELSDDEVKELLGESRLAEVAALRTSLN